MPSNVALIGSHKAAVLKRMDITEVCEGLYLSDFESLTAEKITSRGVTTIINAAALERPKIEMPGVNVIQLPIYDVPTENIGKHFDETANTIQLTKENGSNTLVHCALGISRSVTICLAYLVKYGKMTLRSAYFMLKEKRPIIRPNEGFWKQLIAFETSISGKATVKMIYYPMGSTPDVYKTLARSNVQRFKASPQQNLNLLLISNFNNFSFQM